MIQTITQEKFEQTLYAREEVYDEIFNFGNNDIIFPKEILYNIRFTECSFTGKNLILKNINLPDIGLLFSNCTFKCKILIQNTSLNSLWFEDTEEIEGLEFDSLSRENSNINLFRFNYDIKNENIPTLGINFSFKNYNFRKDFHFTNVNMKNGNLDIINCKLGNKELAYSKISLENSKIYNLFIYKSLFSSQTSFENSVLCYSSESQNKKNIKFPSIEESSFEQVSFSNCKFDKEFGIRECQFHNTINFNNISSGILRIFSGNFNNYTSFDDANLKMLIIYECKFSEILSIQKAKFNTINITKTIFDKITFFDEITIAYIYKCQRHTIRTIKQQLQHSDNKIDYNRFRGYELQAYYKELKWKENFKDKAILWATKWSTGFEHSWTKALRFVLTGALIFYSLFFISENYMLSLNPGLSSLKDFASGYFRFLIITDFYNPLEQKLIFIDNSNTTGWIVFILGKIVLAFGIYEMIQAFRKFKA
ncbi:hypothetical protein [Flavobacterium sp.]|uniref:hypothetical protein n=1 Tax=Flavobacterium sp. TaxID=239 RepID=UPI003A8DFCDA